MAGSLMTFTYDDGSDGIGQKCNLKLITASWVSDDSTGAVRGTTRKIVGRIVKAVTVPSGSVAPTDLYDIAITDEQSVDVLGSCQSTLQNRSATNTQEVYFLVLNANATPIASSAHPVVCNSLLVSVSNAGNSKAGTIYIYYEPI